MSTPSQTYFPSREAAAASVFHYVNLYAPDWRVEFPDLQRFAKQNPHLIESVRYPHPDPEQPDTIVYFVDDRALRIAITDFLREEATR